MTRRGYQQLARVFGAIAMLGALGPVFLRVVGSAVGMMKPDWWLAFVNTSFSTLGIGLVLAFVAAGLARSKPEDLWPRAGKERIEIAVGTPFRGGALGAATLVSFLILGAIAGRVGHGAVPLPAAIAWLFATIAAYVVAFFVTTSARVVIGSDGFSVIESFRTRFVSYADIKSVSASESVLTVEHEGGARETFRLMTTPTRQRVQQVATICAKINEARALFHSGGAADASLLDRRGRSLDEWRTWLAELISERDDYRSARLSPDDALRIVEHADAEPERRVAAAVALSSLPGAREKIRVAASTCANDRLRIALEKASEGELDEEALGSAPESAKS